MSNNNELWQAFFTEVSEQLDNLELILSAAGAEQQADIHQLFRDFHTIKSSCAMMDFHSMEKIAHASEDYLDLVRKGRATLVPGTIQQLLGGIDWLKSQLQQAKHSGEAPPENPALVQSLRALSGSNTATTPQAAADTDRGDSKTTTMQASTLSQDEVTEFASACQQELLPGLAPGAEAAKVKRALNKLVSICNLVGFTAISALLKKYIRHAATPDPGRATATAAEIIERIVTIEDLYAVDCGSAALRTVYLDTLYADFAQLSGRIDYLLDLIEQNPQDMDTVHECEGLLQTLAVNANLFGYSQLLTFFRYVLQTLRSIRRGDIPNRRAAMLAIRQAVDFPIAERLQAGESDAVRAELQSRLADLSIAVAQAIHADSQEDPRDTITKAVELDRQVLDLLMPASLADLQRMVAEGRPLCEIDIDMDCEPQLMDALVNWISTHGNLIHNRSVFGEASAATDGFALYICFLAAFSHPFDEVDAGLHHIDPARKAFRCRAVPYRNQSTARVGTAKPQSAKPVPAPAPATSTPSAANATLRIESHTLDDLMTQVGEMIMVRNMMAHAINDEAFDNAITRGRRLLDDRTARLTDTDIAEWQAVVQSLTRAQQAVQGATARMQQSVKSIQNRILDLRVMPIAAVFNRIPQLVQKMAESQHKEIRLLLDGKDVRLDKGMVDVLMEPLIHLVRNCIDHGIETPADRIAAGKPAQATLSLSALQEGSTLLLEIADDGRGINLERIRDSAIRKGFIQPTDVLTDQETCKLIFLPGFSTAEVITETSGRGVGMDVVITRINHIGGDIDVQSTPGHGTRFTMTLPLSAAIQGVVMVRSAGQLYAIPQRSVIEVLSVPASEFTSLHGQSSLLLRREAVPVFPLPALVLQAGTPDANGRLLFDAAGPAAGKPSAMVVVLGYGKQRIGVQVDDVDGREDLFVRELHRELRAVPAIAGASARGNGELVFILNSSFLLQYAARGSAAWLNEDKTGTSAAQ